jgi:hypothetical protein
MKRCPSCNRTYTDLSLNFCLEDGAPLVSDAARASDPHATLCYPAPRDTSEPPPTEIYRQETPILDQVPVIVQPGQWSPTPPISQMPQTGARKKSNAVWWILGGVAVVGIIGIGFVIMILALVSMGTDSRENTNKGNVNNRVVNRNTNTNVNSTNLSNTNTPSTLPASLTDDFSVKTWPAGNYKFGDVWYADDEYHMRSKEKTFLVMYAPSNDYNTENATVRVTTRSVDGTATTSGYGLIVEGKKTENNELEDYTLLIYTGEEPQFEIVVHKAGNQTTLVPWTKSSVIRSGTSPNQLEVRAEGTDLSFYINGQYVTRITDTENFKRGVAGFYTSDTTEVAFDDLEIRR